MRAAPALVAGIVTAASLALAPAAAALECPAVVIERRYELAEAAFVGRVTGVRPAPGAEDRLLYRFAVEQEAKGSLGPEIELRAAAPLVDAQDRPILQDASIGVFVAYDGAVPTTGSCSLTDPGALLAVSDQPKGTGIKLGVGVVILAAVIAFSVLRLRRRQRRLEEERGAAA